MFGDRMRRWSVLALWVLPWSAAQAQEDVCRGGWNEESWTQQMDEAEVFFDTFQVEEAKELLERTRLQVPCIKGRVDPDQLGRFAQQMTVVYFFDQDEDLAFRWGMLARELVPVAPWPRVILDDHPLHHMIDFAVVPSMSGPKDKNLVPPKKGAIFMNGTFLDTPQARTEVPGFIQIFDKEGQLTESYWQDGSAFHEELLSKTAPVPLPPKWYVPGGAHPAPIQEQPKGSSSGLSATRLVASGGMAVLAGALYAIGGASHQGLDNATSTDELAAARTRINTLTMTSAVFAAGAVGVGVTAFVGQESGLRLGVRF